MNDFLIKMCDILELDDSEVTYDLKYQEIEEWDSLAQLSVLAYLQDEFDIVIEVEELKCYETLRDLFDFISSKAT